MCTLQTQIGHSALDQYIIYISTPQHFFVYLGGGPVAGVHEHAVADVRQN